MELGWVVYDQDLADPRHVEAITRLRPKAVRWFCSVDRHVVTNSPIVFPWEARYGQAWQALAAAGVPLIVQLQMKRPDWTAGDPNNLVGAGLWKAGPQKGWPADPEAKWIPFVRTLAAALKPHSLDVRWGAWNEPDWRLTWPWADRAAPATEWTTGQFLIWPLPPSHAFGWTGGHARLQDLRARLPEMCWTSDGVGLISADWLARTAADPTISLIDVHVYGGTDLSNTLDYTCRVIDAFDRARPDARLPILVGEYGDDANGTPFSIEWRDRALRFNQALTERYPGRLLGVCAHTQGTRQGTTYPPLWTVL